MTKALAFGDGFDPQPLVPSLEVGGGVEGVESSNPLVTWLALLATCPHPKAIQEPPATSHLISLQKDTYYSEITRIFEWLCVFLNIKV